MGFVITADALFKAIQPGGTSDWIDKALSKWVSRFSKGDHQRDQFRYLANRKSDYEYDRLHYGADLSPDACPRKTWYSTHGIPRDPMDLGTALRLHGGEFWESVFAEAISDDNPGSLTQVVVQPIRPSVWAWAPGHADVLVPQRAHLVEVKAPRARLFDFAKGDSRRLVKTGYRWQASAYFHELRRRGRARTASFLFIDREGSHKPIEVALEGELLIPLGAIIEREIELAPLLTQREPPSRIAGSLEVRVWKGPPVKKGEPRRRKVIATEKRAWNCSYCDFADHCQPGPEKTVVALSEHDPRRHEALAAAERSWTTGSKTTPQVARFGLVSDEDEAGAEDEPAAAELEEVAS